MSDESFEIVRSSGNLHDDLGYADADLRQAKATLAGEIVKVLDEDGLSTRQAETRTGISHSEFSRIRRANLARFTLDRLMHILHRLGQDVEVSVSVKRHEPRHAAVGAQHP